MDAQVGPIRSIAQGNRAVTAAARSGLPIWLAVSAALNPPPTAAVHRDGTEGSPAFHLPELYVMTFGLQPQECCVARLQRNEPVATGAHLSSEIAGSSR